MGFFFLLVISQFQIASQFSRGRHKCSSNHVASTQSMTVRVHEGGTDKSSPSSYLGGTTRVQASLSLLARVLELVTELNESESAGLDTPNEDVISYQVQRRASSIGNRSEDTSCTRLCQHLSWADGMEK
jgi:hypothetical protein